jgi:glyoxylase-like metal-dependent hydrolase (beta-lactamase superfamily II)
LELKVITASPEGFWVDSTLISGAKDAILVDAALTRADAHRVVAAILDSKKNLTTVYITHFHPDHYFGLEILKQAFPKAKFVAKAETVADIKKTSKDKVKQWKPMYGDNLADKPVIPDVVKGNTLTLEGEALELVGPVQGDSKNNSYVWIPSLHAVICGDIVYSGIHPWTAETNAASRKDWIATIDKISALGPTIVVAGHKRPDLKDDPAALQATKSYLVAFDEAAAASKTADELQAKMKSKYPALGMDVILKFGAEAAFPPPSAKK